jgi:hypothetical protein
MDAIVAPLAPIGLAIAAPRWGVAGADDPDGPEWERRRKWRRLRARAHGPMARSG